MKIITWNINGYRAITGQNPSKRYGAISRENKLFNFVSLEKPDVICLQETKACIEQIDEELRGPEGYFGYYHSCSSKKGYSGVVTFSKQVPERINFKLGNEKFDVEGRMVETHYKEFILLNIYFPKGYADTERLDYKMEFYDAVYNHIDNLKEINNNIIICGDYNTAHQAIDLARADENENSSGYLKVERDKLNILIDKGYIDCFRNFEQGTGNYTWWSQRGRARENNIGWRIDYHFCSKSLKNKLKSCQILADIQGSDHCPVVLEIDE